MPSTAGGTELRSRTRVAALLVLLISGCSASPAFATGTSTSDAAVAIKGTSDLPTLAERLQALLPGGAESQARATTAETAALAQRKLDERAAAAARATRARKLAAIRHLAIPAWGHISASFGSRGYWTTRHTGLDINARYGDRVHAVTEGRVVKSTYDRAYGYVIVIRGRGVDIWYAHLSKRDVKTGQKVRLGQTIGRVGSTGHATGSHLHLEVRRHDLPTNPATFLWGSHRGIAGDTPAWARARVTTLAEL